MTMVLNGTALESGMIETELGHSALATIDRAKMMLILTQQDFEDAAKFLIEIKRWQDEIKNYWKDPKAAAHEAHSNICSKEKMMLTPLVKAESDVKMTMTAYQRMIEMDRRKAEEEARILKQQESEKLLQEAIEAEQHGKQNEATAKMFLAEMVSDMVITATSQVAKPTAQGISMSRTWKARVTDPKLVPAYANGFELRSIDLAELNRLARATSGSIKIAGIEFYEDITLSARKGA